MKSLYVVPFLLFGAVYAMDQDQNQEDITSPLHYNNPMHKLMYAAALAKRGNELNEQALAQWQQLQQQAQQQTDDNTIISPLPQPSLEKTDITEEKK